MDRRVATVLMGFNNLTDDQKRDVWTEIEKYIRTPDRLKEELAKSWVVMGPVERGCPCCGR
jgi:hypothetical protein